MVPKTIKEVPKASLYDSNVNLDHVDFSKPEKYLREIFSFLQEYVIFTDNSNMANRN